MIHFTSGDILGADVEALVNPVNCVGVMGRGLASQVRQAYPGNFRAYAVACRHSVVVPGRVHVFETDEPRNPRFIMNFPTKRHWRDTSRLEDIEDGLVALVGEVQTRGIKSIAVPPLGCGLGGLSWRDVCPRIEREFGRVPSVRTVVFEPRESWRQR